MKSIILLIFLWLPFGDICAAGMVIFSLNEGVYNYVPEPRLKSPVYETAAIKNNQPLEFSWWNDSGESGGFVFRLYKGYKMLESNLLLKETLPQNASSFEASPDLFEVGKVYTWSLTRISFAGYKSDRSFNSFRVIKE